jgi:hypothetical protein
LFSFSHVSGITLGISISTRFSVCAPQTHGMESREANHNLDIFPVPCFLIGLGIFLDDVIAWFSKKTPAQACDLNAIWSEVILHSSYLKRKNRGQAPS